METVNSIVDFVMNNKATLALAIPLVTRAYYALKNGGGLVGVWRGLMFGTNTPK